MSKSGLLPKILSENFNIYESCIKGKIANKSFSKQWKSLELFEVIHSNICGPLRTKTHKEMEYFITFTDDYSRYGHIYLIEYKSGAIEKFKEYKLKVENQFGKSIKSLNNDRGGEYEAMDFLCKKNGIRHLFTMPYKPQQNGIAKRPLRDKLRSKTWECRFIGYAENGSGYKFYH